MKLTKEQHREILRQHLYHPLWNKPQTSWTEKDIANLESLHNQPLLHQKTKSGKNTQNSGKKYNRTKKKTLKIMNDKKEVVFFGDMKEAATFLKTSLVNLYRYVKKNKKQYHNFLIEKV